MQKDATPCNQLELLASMDLNALRAAWGRWIGPPPNHLSAELLRRRLAYQIQSKVFGGLRPDVRRRLDQLDASFKADPNYAPSVAHALTPGTVLVKEWRGKVHKVHVHEHGFSYAGRSFASLSEIAAAITSTKWSGPAFFGLRRSQC